MVSPTFGAIPFSYIERQLFDDVSTVATSFRTREPSVDLDQRASVPIALVFKLSNPLTPTSITNRKCKLFVLYSATRYS